MLRFYYGTLEKNIDVTQKVVDLLQVGDYIVIPADDHVRARIFTDPCFKIVKHILVGGLSNTLRAFDNKVAVLIDTRTNTVLDDIGLTRHLLTKTKLNPVERVQALHPLIQLKQGSMLHEFPEQCMAMRFLKGDETILEIGGNVGRNSLIMSSILDDSSRLVVLECSPTIAADLATNKEANGSKFQIEPAALSARKLVQRGWITKPSEEIPIGYTRVPTLTYQELQAKHDLTFDTLVLDCEGAFYYILLDFPEILNSIKTIITENDYRDVEHKNAVETTLLAKGFQSIYKENGGQPAKDAGFQHLDHFYQVWQLASVGAVIKSGSEIRRKGAAFMDRFPHVFFFRYDKYAAVDSLIDVSDCSIQIIDEPSALAKMVDPNYPILVTFGDSNEEYNADVYSVLQNRMSKRWIHYKELPDMAEFTRAVNYCYIQTCIAERATVRPIFSLFTTCYNSYDKIERAYKSIASQTLQDWEWIILDDSPSDDHFAFLRKKFALEPRVRLYRRSANSANIGNVKNEAVGLCRGAYALEMDHDDEILPDCLADAARAFEDPEVGFVYMDFINTYEDGRNFWYGDFICLGYGGYYCQKYKGRWVNVYMTPNVNNITLSHIVALPNHPRIWRTETLLKLGNYSEFLPICDDQEILMRTAMKTKMVKIPKLAYVQYMNDGNNNFSLIRNREINRLGPQFIVPQFYTTYGVHDRMKELGAYEDETYLKNRSRIWHRTDYEHKYCNKRELHDYDKQYCVLGKEGVLKHIDAIRSLYQDGRNDFLVLDGTGKREELCVFLDTLGLDRMKCYSIPDNNRDQLIAYFHRLYKTCEQTEILE